MHDADDILDALEKQCPRAAAAARNRSPVFDAELATATGFEATPEIAIDHHGTWREKLAALWIAVQSDQHRDLSPPSRQARLNPAFLRPENLATAFSHDGDTLPRTGSVRIDTKMIHVVGAVARCQLRVAPDNGWRGILGHGAEGLVRVSNGSGDPRGGFAPGVALKFPRTAMSSADLLFGASFDLAGVGRPLIEAGQFLEVELRTWLGSIPTDPRLRNIHTLFWIFERMREETMGCPAFSGRALSPQPLCTHDQDGTAAPAGEDPVGLILRPLAPAVEAWREAWTAGQRRGNSDFRGAFLEMPELAMYEVLGAKADGTTRPVGELHVTTRFAASRYGDERLYFRHSPGCPDPSVLE